MTDPKDKGGKKEVGSQRPNPEKGKDDEASSQGTGPGPDVVHNPATPPTVDPKKNLSPNEVQERTNQPYKTGERSDLEQMKDRPSDAPDPHATRVNDPEATAARDRAEGRDTDREKK